MKTKECWGEGFELEALCGRERGVAERESAAEILSRKRRTPKRMAEGEGFELEALCGRERGVAERESAAEILSRRRRTPKRMAEGEGFEPPVPVRVQRFSRPPDY